MLCGEDLQFMMAHQFETRPRSCYDRFEESLTVSNSESLELLRESTEEQREVRPSVSQWQESSTVPGDEMDEYLVLKAEISLQFIGNLLELFETVLKQLETEKECSGMNEESSKTVESCASSEEELIGNSARLGNGHHTETSDDSFSTSESEQPGCSTNFAEAEQDSGRELDWSLIDKELESLAESFEAEQDNFNEEVGCSCGDEQPKSWINLLEAPQDDSSQEVDWSFDDDNLKSGTNSVDILRENSNEESKRTFGDVTMIRPIGAASSSCLQCGNLFDEYISNLCKCFEHSIERENGWKTTAGNDHSSGADGVESPSAKSFGIYMNYSGPGEEPFPAADLSFKPYCYQCLLLPTQSSPSTPNPVEAHRRPTSAVCVPPGVFEPLSSATDEYYTPAKANGTYGPIGTPPLSRLLTG